MIKNKFYLFSQFLCFTLCCVGILSCKNEKVKEVEVINQKPTINQDSIDRIRLEIHAEEKEKKLDKLFTKKARWNRFNGCVLVAQRGQIIYKDGFGYTNYKTKEKIDLNSTFQLSSTSKPFTSTAILILKDRGMLNLTDNVQKFIPEFPYEKITIQLLLTHRSGLSNYLYFGENYCDKENCYNGVTFDNNSVLEIMKNHRPNPYTRPDRRFEYSNTNYVLLASIVERVSGLNFQDFMEENIFKPLHMKNTWVNYVTKKYPGRNKTTGHTSAGRIEKNEYADNIVGDKGIYSTVEDLFLFDQSFYSNKILSEESIEQAFTGYSNERRGIRNYGLGWRITKEKGKDKVVYHNGWWHGYNSLFYRRLPDQSTVIILSNRDNKSIYKIDDVLSIITP